MLFNNNLPNSYRFQLVKFLSLSLNLVYVPAHPLLHPQPRPQSLPLASSEFRWLVAAHRLKKRSYYIAPFLHSYSKYITLSSLSPKVT